MSSPETSRTGRVSHGPPWWKGDRGEWLVVAQLALMLLVFLGPRTAPGLPPWPFAGRTAGVVGLLLMACGGALMLAGALRLGPGLTPLPYPKDGAALIETGVFALVRHPIYSGGLVLAIGWALIARGWLTVAYVVLLFLLLDFKSRQEERWLREKFAGYAAYQARTRRLIPFVY